jgi:hypothetical protein
MKRILFISLFSLILVQLISQNYCIKNRFSSTALFTDTQIQKDSNIVFAVAKHWNSAAVDTLRMDIYYPNSSVETLAKRPLIVFAFGGGFIGGTRSDMVYFCKEFAKRGYVTATVDYRLGWGCLDMTAATLCLCNDYIGLYSAAYRAMQDFNSSLRFLSYNSSKYKIDTNFVFVSGVSAGSITAMNAAFMNQAEIDSKLSWVHSSFGSIDSSGNSYPKNYKIKGVLDFCGAVFDTAYMTNNSDISIVSFHDSIDCVVNTYHDYLINCTGNCHNLFPMDGSAVIYSKAIKNGTCAELNINPAIGHCSSNYGYVINQGSCFLKRVLCNTCSSVRYKNESNIASCDSLGSLNGIDNFGSSIFFQVYPNPARDLLHFELNADNIPAILTIYDMNGKEVIRQSINESRFNISVSSFPAGIYQVKMQSENAIRVEKIVINR